MTSYIFNGKMFISINKKLYSNIDVSIDIFLFILPEFLYA